MEQNQDQKRLTSKKKTGTTIPIRVKRETAKLIRAELANLNNKKFGKKVKTDDLIARVLPLITDDDRRNLQSATLSGKDKLALLHQRYCEKNGNISKDDFLSRLVRGEIVLEDENVTLRTVTNK
ncbi:MAG: hypothetical protein AB7F43_06915 [Bacteriovoracia bacterium]